MIKRNRNGLMHPMRSFISDFFNNDNFFEREFMDRSFVPAVNVKESDKSFEIEVAAPGLKKKDFTVNVENRVLHISTESEEENEESHDNYMRKEFSYRSFSRSFSIPEHVDENEVSAAYDDGVLTVTLAKKQETVAQPAKKIMIH